MGTTTARVASAPRSTADLAKAALRRLTIEQQEFTPDNYARAYAQEAGLPPPATAAASDAGGPGASPLAAANGASAHAGAGPGSAPEVPLADWLERVVRGLERGGRHWTTARKKDGLQRVLAANRHHVDRLQQRLGGLLAQWERDEPDATPAEIDPDGAPGAEDGAPRSVFGALAGDGPDVDAVRDDDAREAAADAERAAWRGLVERVGATVRVALPTQDPVADGLSAELAEGTAGLRAGVDAGRAARLAEVCDRADRLLAHRHHLIEQLGRLCGELTDSLGDLAEDPHWAHGPSEAMRSRLVDGLTARGVKSVGELLRATRERQRRLRQDRDAARDALKAFMNQMLGELAELGAQSGRFQDSVGRYADVIARAETLESLAGVVSELVAEARGIEGVFGRAQRRLHEEHARATALNERVRTLEGELRRLSDEVATDPLTQVANRRGLATAFEAERSRSERGATPLAVALLDIDNFKRLNDTLGHAAGDEALRKLAAQVARTLRPTDHVARYGGEEFVLLLPATPTDEAVQVLSRLQRNLSGGLFMHEHQQVFVTFSAGITAWRHGEALEVALERADHALYEAKRSGKNRSCVA